MKRFSKVLVFILAVALSLTACFTLVGCSKEETVTLTTYTMFGDGDGHRVGWEAAMKHFTDSPQTIIDADGKEKKVKVVFEDRSKWTNDYDTQVTNDLSGSSPSDLIFGFTGARNSGYIAKTANVSDIRTKLTSIKSGIDYATKANVSATDLTTAGWKKGFQLGFVYNTANNWAATDFATIAALEAKITATGDSKAADYSTEPNTYFNMYALAELGDKIVSEGNITKAWWETNATELKTSIKKTLEIAKTAGFSGSATVETSAEKAAFATGKRGMILEGSWAFSSCITPDAEKPAEILSTAKFAALPSATKYAFTGTDHGWQITKKAVDDAANNHAKLQVLAKLVNYCYTSSQAFVTGGAGGVYLNNNEGTPTEAGVALDSINSLTGKIAVLPVENRLSTAAAAALFKDGLVARIQLKEDSQAEANKIYAEVLAKF